MLKFKEKSTSGPSLVHRRISAYPESIPGGWKALIPVLKPVGSSQPDCEHNPKVGVGKILKILLGSGTRVLRMKKKSMCTIKNVLKFVEGKRLKIL